MPINSTHLDDAARDKFESKVFKDIHITKGIESLEMYLMVEHYVLLGGEVHIIENDGKLSKSKDRPMELFRLILLGDYDTGKVYPREAYKLEALKFLEQVRLEAGGDQEWSINFL